MKGSVTPKAMKTTSMAEVTPTTGGRIVQTVTRPVLRRWAALLTCVALGLRSARGARGARGGDTWTAKRRPASTRARAATDNAQTLRTATTTTPRRKECLPVMLHAAEVDALTR